MRENRTCSICGRNLAGVPEGLCPECLLKAGLPTGEEIGPETATAAARPRFIPPAPGELAPLFPQLEIMALIGQGGMGAVYKARQKQLERNVALKILPPDVGCSRSFAERFAREARALAKLSHPGVVTLYEFGQVAWPRSVPVPAPPAAPGSQSPDTGSRPALYYFLMEFVDGVNLGQLLRAGKLAAKEALAIVPQICDALQYAHDRGIVHRDIKPENILLGRDGQVKVADFGIARMVGERGMGSAPPARSTKSESHQPGATAPEMAPTEPGKIIGTPRYMAPEQHERPLDVDHRADIYSLGVVLYQMLTGELPAGKFEPPSSRMRGVQMDVRIDEVVLRALDRDPELRYQQASVLKTQLETIAATIPSGNIPARRKPFLSARWKRLLKVAGVLAGVLAAASVVVVQWAQRQQPFGVIIGAESPDNRYTANGRTEHAMRIFGNDKFVYVFAVQGPQVMERWEVPIPFDELATNYHDRLVADFAFDPHGQIVWSDDSLRVSFLVRGTEVSALNVVDRSNSSQPGFQPCREVLLAGNPDLRDSFLDLETGQVLSAPRDLVESLRAKGQLFGGAPPAALLQEWMRSSGVDIVKRVREPGLIQVDGVHMLLAEKTGNQAEYRPFDTASTNRLIQAVEAVEEVLKDSPDNLRLFGLHLQNVHAIRTREGAIALLEILEDNPRSGHTRLRYKLAEAPGTDPGAAPLGE